MAATYSTRPAPRDPKENRNARSDKRHDQGRFPAMILALIVHGIFFAILIFSVSWQVKPTAPLMAEVWDSLPPSRNAPPVPVPTPTATPPTPVEPPIAKKTPPPEIEKAPPQPTKAEIDLKVKQEREVVEKRAREEKELADKKKAEDVKKEQDKKKEELLKKQRDEVARMANERALDNKIKEEQAASQARENQARAAQQAAQKAAADGYAQKIAALIRSRANVPDTVVGRPKVQIQLRLLVNGVVFDAKVVKPSGNPVYDEAIERAINGIQMWPLPERPELLGSTRTLILNIEHER
jgi:colicin import membrane protein